MIDKRAKILERVRGLLAKADSTTFPAEADSFRAKADELMRAYAIEQWQLDQTGGAGARASKPEVRQMDFSWWRTSNRSEELWTLFFSTARHCRCVVATRGYGSAGYSTIPVIGLSSDLDYMDLLFTHLMLQMGKKLGEGVRPIPDASLGENARRLRETGMQRASVCKMLWEGGYVELGGAHADWDSSTHWEWLPAATQKAIRAKVRKAGEAYEREHGLESTTGAHPETWQRSFATAFVSEVGNRYRAMRAEQAKSDSNSMALAVRDMREEALAMYTEMWPEPEATGSGKGSGRALTYKEPKIDSRAYNEGTKAGREAQLVSRGDKGVKGTDSKRLGQ